MQFMDGRQHSLTLPRRRAARTQHALVGRRRGLPPWLWFPWPSARWLFAGGRPVLPGEAPARGEYALPAYGLQSGRRRV